MSTTEAQRAASRRSYLKNREKRLAARRAYSEAHKEQERAYGQRYYAENREAVLEKTQTPEAQEQRRAAHARFVEKNPTALRDWKREHKAEISEAGKEYYRRRGKYIIRMRQYGLTQEQFEHMLETQGNACAICRLQFGDTKADAPHVDHNHATGMVRALLCINCNFLIGHCREDPELLKAAGLYLQSQKGN